MSVSLHVPQVTFTSKRPDSSTADTEKSWLSAGTFNPVGEGGHDNYTATEENVSKVSDYLLEINY